MPDVDQVKAEIVAIAGSIRNVRDADVERIVGKLKKLGFVVQSRPATHGKVYQINTETFSVCTHHKGGSQLKTYSVRNFLRAMTALRLYGDDDEQNR